jgi:hypothetical protein
MMVARYMDQRKHHVGKVDCVLKVVEHRSVPSGQQNVLADHEEHQEVHENQGRPQLARVQQVCRKSSSRNDVQFNADWAEEVDVYHHDRRNATEENEIGEIVPMKVVAGQYGETCQTSKQDQTQILPFKYGEGDKEQDEANALSSQTNGIDEKEVVGLLEAVLGTHPTAKNGFQGFHQGGANVVKFRRSTSSACSRAFDESIRPPNPFWAHGSCGS